MNYVIATTARSGSSWLCQLLSSTDVAGKPGEHFNQQVSSVAVPHIVKQHSTSNGVFGVKCSRSAYRNMQRVWIPPEHFVYLYRKDIVRQAISLYRAIRTQKWNAREECKGDEPRYDYFAIKGVIRNIRIDQKWWREYLQNKDCFTITYEELLMQPKHVVRCVLSYIGVTTEVEPVSTMKVQRDSTTQKFVCQYVVDHAQDSNPLPMEPFV